VHPDAIYLYCGRNRWHELVVVLSSNGSFKNMSILYKINCAIVFRYFLYDFLLNFTPIWENYLIFFNFYNKSSVCFSQIKV